MSTTLAFLAPDHRVMLLEFLQRFIPDVAVWAFGSRVKGTARPYSDLDLVLFTSAEQRPWVEELKDALDESDLPFLVELLVWDELPQAFHNTIKAQYAVVQEGRPEPVKACEPI